MAPEGKDARDPMDAIMAEVAQETGGTGHAYPRPGRVVEELVVPFPRPRNRRETVTDPAFSQLKQRALEALEG